MVTKKPYNVNFKIKRNSKMTELPKISETYFDPVQLSLQENQKDLNAFEQRAGEETLSYEELLKDLKSHGKL